MFFSVPQQGKSEFIGRALCKPVVKLSNERYEGPKFPPSLEWWDIHRGPDRAGELLATFELLQVRSCQRLSGQRGSCFSHVDASLTVLSLCRSITQKIERNIYECRITTFIIQVSVKRNLVIFKQLIPQFSKNNYERQGLLLNNSKVLFLIQQMQMIGQKPDA